ncbi:hypothetical protein [Azospirillum tabaci]|uniref:hypothetical protein n=1 Tax=Azospirillum tabaci TaxID=2752310 RepID=UPI00166124A8|nr:hypothetical protein [Azospirillum tabaci]
MDTTSDPRIIDVMTRLLGRVPSPTVVGVMVAFMESIEADGALNADDLFQLSVLAPYALGTATVELSCPLQRDAVPKLLAERLRAVPGAVAQFGTLVEGGGLA